MMDINHEIAKLNWEREPKGLYAPIAYTMAAGGKRVRPQLAMIACGIFGGNEQEVAPAAMALEVFHNFTLLHDDVMDKAEVRRGRPTVHIQWNENTAILSGDQMMIEAYKLLAEVPESKLHKVLRLFNEMATEICEGQQYDVDFESQEHVTIEEYLKMIRLKTSVLLATALQIGSYLAGANEAQQEALYQFGINVGLAFQIQDDILDVWGDPKTFGKAVGGDISCNKKTYVYLTAQQLADAELAEELHQWYGSVLDDNTEKIAAVKGIFEQLNVRAACEAVVEDYTQKALLILDTLPQNAATEQLRQLANKLNTRKD
ncbi:MAG: polyprenyl synthetase family protein [Paludibacteraceae bacterium]|nr:polyprenyl synthetase family protein [Paludibacteraceae bacterium]